MTLTTRSSRAPRGPAEPLGRSAWGRRLLVELLIGFALAGLLVMVAWASSNAIPFVYGGY